MSSCVLALVAEVPSTLTELGLEAASAISPGVSEPSAFGTLWSLWRVNGLGLAYSVHSTRVCKSPNGSADSTLLLASVLGSFADELESAEDRPECEHQPRKRRPSTSQDSRESDCLGQ